jgi:hypothetical protein
MRRQCFSSIGHVLAALLSLSLAFLPQNPAFAGTAPPTNSPGGSISPKPGALAAPNSTAEISLASQRIELNVTGISGAEVTPGHDASEAVQATASSTFVLRNSTNTTATQGVFFPLNDVSGIKDSRGNLPAVDGFAATVNGTTVAHSIVTRTNPYGTSEPPLQWAVISATLPPNGEVSINTAFVAPAAGQLPLAKLNYALDTAAAWAGRVGQSAIVLALPYLATNENVFLDDSTPGGKFDGNSVVWNRRNFEPGNADNLKVTMLAPQVWQAILDARAAATANPSSAEAQRALAQAYQAAIALDNGVPQSGTGQFVTMAEKTYATAIELNPSSPDLHAELAQLLLDARLASELNTRGAAPLLEKIVSALQAALQLDPNHTAAARLLAQVKQIAQTLPAATARRVLSAVATAEAALSPTTAGAQATAAPANTSSAGAAQATSEAQSTQTPSANAGAGAGTAVTETQTQTGAVLEGPAVTAVVIARATISAMSAITGTLEAPAATAVAEAQATLGAASTALANTGAATTDNQSTAESAAAASTPVAAATGPTSDPASSTSTGSAANPAAAGQTLVARNGILTWLAGACGVVLLIGVIGAVLVARMGRKRAEVTDASSKEVN